MNIHLARSTLQRLSDPVVMETLCALRFSGTLAYLCAAARHLAT